MLEPIAGAPAVMRALEAREFSIDALQLRERPVPRPGPDEILVRVRAASLNYRDLAILVHGAHPELPLPFGLASDGSGEVVEVGRNVRRFQVGDRAVPTFTQGWHDGLPTPEQRTTRTLGGPLSGMLQEYVAVPAEDAVHAPPHLTHREAATLPVAALTAWSALRAGGVKAGDTVLVLGTGGVALFALQFARLSGARVIVLSSSDEKLDRARRLGAEIGINYGTTPDWSAAVRDATGGRGVEIVVETAGATLGTSLACVAFGGFVGVVGLVAGLHARIALPAVFGPMVRIEGIAIGSRARFEEMNRAIVRHALRPVVDSVFPLERTAEALGRLQRGLHFGKIVVDVA